MGRQPRGDEAGVTIGLKVTPAVKKWLVDRAELRGEPPSETLRAMMTFASRFMPPQWQPDDKTGTGSTESSGTDASPIAKLIQDRPSMAQGRELRNARNKT